MQMFVGVPTLEILVSLFVFVLGLVVGSFLNVVIYRYNSGITLGGRSMCFGCGKTLRWYELIPVFSFIIQKARCRGCEAKISWQYAIVEIMTGLLFLEAFFVAQNYLDLAYLIVQFSLLVVISVYDLRHKIIPDLFSYLFAFLAFAYLLLGIAIRGGDFIAAWPDLIAGPVYFLPFAGLWYFSKGRWMGFGDAKLALGIGWFLGMSKTYIAMIISFWAGSLVGIFLIFFSRFRAKRFGVKEVTMKSEIPFGPFLIFGLLVMVFFGSEIMDIVRLFIFYA